MRPDQKSEDSDGDRREGHEAVAENTLAREAGDDFAHDAHRGQNHDVDGGMRVEPEQVLKQHRVAAQLGIKDSQMQGPLRGDQHDRDGNDRRSQKLDDAGGVVRPDKKR